MLPFQNDIIDQALKQKSGAWILSPGLGMYSILENLLLKLEESNTSDRLIIVLNIDSNPVFDNFLQTPPHRFKLVNSNYTSDQRKSLWLSGGILFVTPRVLIVDILKKVLPCQFIGGIIIPLPFYYSISDSTVESFICNLYNQYLRSKRDVYNKSTNNADIITASQINDENKNENTTSSKSTYDGFIKVFSDNPRQFYGSYSKFQEQLECFKVRKVFIWPRFRDEVIKSLNKSPDVVELMAHMPPYQKKIHDLIQTVMKMCIDEIHRMNLMIDTSIITLDNALFRSFYILLKSNIDPVYHKLSKKFKQLIRDLDTLRHMINDLMQLDSVSFYEKISDLKKEINEDSIFLLLDEVHQIFELSQARIYQITQKENKDGSKDSNITLILEDNPKIHILDDILKEIDSHSENRNDYVLVLVKDIRTCEMISSYLCFPNKEYFTLNLFKNHLMRSNSKYKANNPSKKSLLNKDSTINLHSIPSLMSAVLECENQNGISITNNNHSYEIDFDKYFGLFPPLHGNSNEHHLNVIIHPFKDARRSIYDFKPKFIVLYDPDLTMIREIEIYKASHPGRPVRVYFTIFKDSVEEIKYKNSIQNEKTIFESIVREKANMVFTEESTHDLTLKEKIESKPTIIVDVREFRSKLPVILYSNNINIVPQQLLIADYILTPSIAVERKSISDLFQSFSSGRLYNQMKKMCRHYEIPILLIEFDQNMPFRLQTHEDMTDHITPSAISSKITLITKSFPKMRIIWTRSPYETAQIFIELKENNPQPNPSMYESNSNQDDEDNDIFEPIDVLKKLPGINDENVHKLLSKIHTKDNSRRFEVKDTTLSSIASMTKEELTTLIGINNGTILYEFLHNDPFDT